MPKSLFLAIVIAGAFIAGAIVFTQLDRPKTVMETINEAAELGAKVDAQRKAAKDCIESDDPAKDC